jgi:DNA-binding NarL/FixJ family response regulator
MAARRVFIIWTHPLFHESVRLLLNHPLIEWVGATSDYAAAQEKIINLRPDTILVEEVEEDKSTRAQEIFDAISWKMQVIGLNLANNRLSLYHLEPGIVGQVDDLLNLILKE